MTGPEGQYEIRIVRPGQYYLGVNLNHTPTRDTPYPRWFYPGTEDPASAIRIDFTGKPEVRTYDFTLPERQTERAIEGLVLTHDGQPKPRAVVTVRDSSRNAIGQAFADQNGRFALHMFVQTPYRLYAVWPSDTAGQAVSALPMEIAPDSAPLDLRLLLTQPGNLFLEDRGNSGR
jgi:hypothetical protein